MAFPRRCHGAFPLPPARRSTRRAPTRSPRCYRSTSRSLGSPIGGSHRSCWQASGWHAFSWTRGAPGRPSDPRSSRSWRSRVRWSPGAACGSSWNTPAGCRSRRAASTTGSSGVRWVPQAAPDAFAPPARATRVRSGAAPDRRPRSRRRPDGVLALDLFPFQEDGKGDELGVLEDDGLQAVGFQELFFVFFQQQLDARGPPREYAEVDAAAGNDGSAQGEALTDVRRLPATRGH